MKINPKMDKLVNGHNTYLGFITVPFEPFGLTYNKKTNVYKINYSIIIMCPLTYKLYTLKSGFFPEINLTFQY